MDLNPLHDRRQDAGSGVSWRTVSGSHPRAWIAVAAFCLLAVSIYVVRQRAAEARAKTAGARRPIVPVSVVPAKMGDLNRYLTALGSVTPFATVTVKPRVSGQIVKIYFQEGQMVKQGDPLLEIDPRPYQATLTQNQGQLARDRAILANAKITLDRDELLIRQGVIAQQDLDNQGALYEQAIGTVKNDEGLVEAARLNLFYCHIVSPILGRIGLRLVDLGNFVQPTDSQGLVVITQLQPISVVFTIPEDRISDVVDDMRGSAQLPVEAWNRDFSKLLATGYLLTIDNQVDQTTGTVKLRAQFENRDNALFPNEFVNARLLVSVVRHTVLVPTAAVQKSPQGSLVYVVKPDSTVIQRDVKVNATQGDMVSIASGLNPGDRVVVEGVDRLQPGVRVNVKPEPVS